MSFKISVVDSLLIKLSTVIAINIIFFSSSAFSDSEQGVPKKCQSQRVKLQMLGTRGPELLDGQASTSYLIWLDDKARVIVDAGAGSLQRFKQSKAKFEDVDMMLFTHFHVDHSADFSSYIKGAFFTTRSKDLTVFGPAGANFTASATQFVERSIGSKNGLYPYLGRFLAPDLPSMYKIEVEDIPWSFSDLAIRKLVDKDDIRVTTVSTHHGPFPSQAYRVDLAGCSISFSGDMNGRLGEFPTLAKNSDILVAHNAAPEGATGIAANLHMQPSMIGKIANQANVKKLLLTHLMERTVSVKQETRSIIQKHYTGKVSFPSDLDIIRP
ncbi:MAG: MBL fold metallo-hydrolase [Cocleimonas sp.]